MDFRAIASGSGGNCYLLTAGKTRLLIECGLPVARIRQALDYQLSGIRGCLVSHEHQDHAKAVKDLLRLGIPCYMSEGTATALRANNHPGIHFVRHEKPFQIERMTIMPFAAEHDSAEPLGFLIASCGKKLLYLTDSAYCRYKFLGLTHIAIECNYIAEVMRESALEEVVKQRITKSHMSLETMLEFLRLHTWPGLEEVHLLHMSDGNMDAEVAKVLAERQTEAVVKIC